jgi:hypothetical protein
MKISNGIDDKENNSPNYKELYKIIKDDIKNAVIDKFIAKIDMLSKTVDKLKKENSLIKNDLIYILKRVLLNKNEYSKYTSPSKVMQVNNIFSINTLSKTPFLSEIKEVDYNRKSMNNSLTRKDHDKRRFSIDDEFKKSSLNNTSTSFYGISKQNIIQNKINYYLNSLYKHNFADENVAGTTSTYLLNKNESIYDELFSNKSRKNKIKDLPSFNVDENYKKLAKVSEKYCTMKKNTNLFEEQNKNDNIKIHRIDNLANKNMNKSQKNFKIKNQKGIEFKTKKSLGNTYNKKNYIN